MTLKGYYALSFKTCSSFGAHHENLSKDRLYCSQRRRCSAMTRFWQYKVYADIRSGSQDLCKFSLDFVPAPVYYVYTYVTLFRYQVQLFCFDSYLPIRLRRVVKCVTSGDVASRVAKCDPQSMRIFRRHYIVGILTNKANVSI